MKKMTLIVISLFCIPWIAFSQQNNATTERGSIDAKNAFMFNSKIIPISQMDQRKIYNWANGQRSTPAGCQAGNRHAKYARVFGDSAVVVSRPVKKHNTRGNNTFMLNSRIIPISQMDQRKIYNWANGQRSTPSGCQASDRSAKYARVLGDSAVVVSRPAKKHTTRRNNTFMLNSRIIPISQMDQRKIYNWANGQRSTPSGCQASNRHAKYARVFQDSAVVVSRPFNRN